MSAPRPPRAWRALARRLLPPDVSGDLAEGWARRRADDPAEADRWYARQCRRHLARLRPGGLDALRQDVAYGFRGIRRHPVFSGAVVLTLTLALGATTTAFSVWEALFLRSLPVEAPERLVGIYGTDPDASGLNAFQGYIPISHETILDVVDRAETLEGVFAFGQYPASLAGEGDAERVGAQFVSASYFDVLGVRPVLGRGFLAEEGVVGSPVPVTVISHGFWQSRFDGADDVLGRTLVVNGRSLRIVGVAPEGFRGTESNNLPALWLPVPLFVDHPSWGAWLDNRTARFFFGVGRLAPGRTYAQAAAELDRLAEELRGEYPDIYGRQGLQIVPTAEATVAPALRRTAFGSTSAVFGLAVVVLLIACMNVGGLLIVRAYGRGRELAVRSSVGAGRGRLMRQLVTETGLLFLLGGVGAVLLTLFAQGALSDVRPPLLGGNPIEIHANPAVVGFALLATVAAAALFGLAPALKASRTDVATALRAGGRSLGAGGTARVRNALVAGQIGLSLVALVGAGLFVRGLLRAGSLELGFEPDRLGMVSIELGTRGYGPEEGGQLYRDLVDGVAALPGVEAAAVGPYRPLDSSALLPVARTQAGYEDPDVRTMVRLEAVTPGYRETLGMRLEEGRWIASSDGPDAAPVVVLNRTLADLLFPDGDALGRSLVYGPAGTEATVVGVVPTGRYVSLDESPQPALYTPLEQNFVTEATVFVRGRDGVPPLEAVRRTVAALDPGIPVWDLEPASALVGRALWNTRALAVLMVGFGLVGLFLAGLGVYGLVSQTVRVRRREMGLRLALGAAPRQLVVSTLRDVAVLVASGAALGVVVGLVLGRSVESQLYGVSARDPATYAVVTLALAAVALLSAWIPARRAARVDPLETLQAEG